MKKTNEIGYKYVGVLEIYKKMKTVMKTCLIEEIQRRINNF